MYCDQCGTKNRDQAKFCVKCGIKLFYSEASTSNPEFSNEITQPTNSISINQQTNQTSTNFVMQDSPKPPEQSSKVTICRLIRHVGDHRALEEAERKKKEHPEPNLWELIKSLNTLDGRITPSSSWKILSIILIMILGIFFVGLIHNEDLLVTYLIIIAVPGLYLLYASYTTMFVQRLHDLDFSGIWWFLIMPILKIGSSWLVSLFYNPLEFQYGNDLRLQVFALSNIVMWLFIAIIYTIPGKDFPNDYGSKRK